MTTGTVSQASVQTAQAANPAVRIAQAGLELARQGISGAQVEQAGIQYSYGPPASKVGEVSQLAVQMASSAGGTNVAAEVTNAAVQIAYAAGVASQARLDAYTFIMDGHRFYVLPLGDEGDWAYDTTTQEWCQLQTQGYEGLNFGHGVMWDERVIGGDLLNTNLLELDPTQPLDDGFRPVEHIVTGGLATRGRHAIGVANFTLTASVGDDASESLPISLAFSDDNGGTWSQEFNIPLTDATTQLLIWNSLGSFAAPGRVFRITDYAGPIRLDGADCVLTIGNGADSGIEQDQG